MRFEWLRRLAKQSDVLPKRRKRKSSSRPCFVQLCLESLEERVVPANRTWLGVGGDTNWSNPANWTGNQVPGVGDDATFGNQPANSNVDAAFAGTIANLIINTAYLGTITLNRSLTVSINYSQTGGTLSLGSQTLTVGGNFTQTLGTFIAGAASTLAFTGAAAAVDVNVTQALGNLTISSGTTTIAAADTLTVNGVLSMTGSTLTSTTGSVTLAGNVTTNASAASSTISCNLALGAATRTFTVADGAAANDLVLSGIISGVGGGITTAGAGTLLFSGAGANTYTGATTVNAGTLVLNKTAGLNAVAGALNVGDGSGADVVRLLAANIANTSAVTVNSSGTLDLNSFAETISSLAGAGNVTLGSATLTTGDTTSPTFSGVISGTGGLTKGGTGTFTLSGANTYSGATTINAGVVQIGAAGAIHDASAVTVAAGATFNLANLSETVGSLAGVGNATLGSGTLTTGGDGSSTTFSGVMSGTGALVKNGSGAFTLSGSNTYSGGTAINAGTLSVGADNNLGGASGAVAISAATLRVSGSFTSNRIFTFSNANSTIDVVNPGQTLTINSVLVKSGSGSLTVTGSGTLALGSASEQIPDDMAVSVVPPATLDISSHDETISSLGSSGGTIALGTRTLTIGANNASSTFGGVISGAGGVTKVGVGLLNLLAQSTYTGTTTVNQGTLRLGGSSVLANTPTQCTSATQCRVTVANGATLDVFLNSAIGSLEGSGNLTLGNRALTTGDNNAHSTFSGTISGTASSLFFKRGAGTMYLAGNNSGFSGGIRILEQTGGGSTLAGALVGSHTNAFGNSSDIIVMAGAALGFHRGISYAGAVPVTINGDGWLTQGSLLSAGNNRFAGQITLASNSTIQSAVGTLTLTGGVVTAGFTLTATGSGNITETGAVTGAGGITKTGSGTLTFTNANYSGSTTINAGTFSVAGTVGALTVSGGILDPRDAGDSIGILNATSANFSGGGTLRIDLAGSATGGNLTAGTNFDRLNLSGTLTAGGTSVITFVDSGITAGASLVTAAGVVVYSTNTGTFTTLNSPAGHAVSPTYTATQLNVTVDNVQSSSSSVLLDSLPAFNALSGRVVSGGMVEDQLTTHNSLLTKLTVASLDTGVDYTHPALYENIWINQAETVGHVWNVPVSGRLKDVDGDGLITFRDLK